MHDVAFVALGIGIALIIGFVGIYIWNWLDYYFQQRNYHRNLFRTHPLPPDMFKDYRDHTMRNGVITLVLLVVLYVGFAEAVIHWGSPADQCALTRGIDCIPSGK